jgi:hypothetical protein
LTAQSGNPVEPLPSHGEPLNEAQPSTRSSGAQPSDPLE